MSSKNHIKFFYFSKYVFSILIWFSLSTQLVFADQKNMVSESDLVGKWHSSNAMTTVEINADGTWLIQEFDQSGWWALVSDKFVWMYDERNLKDAEDINQILSYTKKKFTLRELDGSITVFSREQ